MFSSASRILCNDSHTKPFQRIVWNRTNVFLFILLAVYSLSFLPIVCTIWSWFWVRSKHEKMFQQTQVREIEIQAARNGDHRGKIATNWIIWFVSFCLDQQFQIELQQFEPIVVTPNILRQQLFMFTGAGTMPVDGIRNRHNCSSVTVTVKLPSNKLTIRNFLVSYSANRNTGASNFCYKLFNFPK